RTPATAPRSKRHYRRARLRRRLPSLREPSRLRLVANTVLRPVAGVVLIARDAPLRRLALGAVRERDARATGLGRDLWRLTALRYGTRRGTFLVESEFDPEIGLLFLSSRARPALEPSRSAPNGELREIVWNHSGLDVAAGLGGGTLLAIPIGHHGVDGAHSFRSLAALSKTRPRLVLDAFDPFLQDAVRPADVTAAVER